MNQPIHNAYWLTRFDSILDSALAQHRAISLIRVDLRFPEYMPATIMDTDLDSAVISRFFESLKAKIQAYQRKKRRANKRVRATTLHYFWCREFGKKRQETLSRDITAEQRYLVLARGFHRSFFAGDTDQAGMV